MLESSLSAIDANFYERAPLTGERIGRTFSPPKLDEIVGNYAENPDLRGKIQEMIDGDSIKKLYAAILLWKVDPAKATNILENLTDDDTKLSVQAQLGFSIVETTVEILALDFLSEQHIYGSNFSKEEHLNRWALAVSTEKKESKREFDKKSLPKWNEVLEARRDAGKMELLRERIEHLKNSGAAAEKFYAAVLLNTIDKEESRKVLESLLTEETNVLILAGDEADNIPARQVAESMLNPQTSFHTSPPTNIFARATKWLEKNYFNKKFGE